MRPTDVLRGAALFVVAEIRRLPSRLSSSGSTTSPPGAGVGNIPNGVAATRYRRLGPSMVAHSLANLVAVVALISSS